MEIKIEGSSEQLQALHQMLYEADNDIEVDEQFGPTEGYQKDALVSALIFLGSSPIVWKVVSAFVKLKQTKIKAEIQKDKNRKKAEVEIFKFYIKEEFKWKEKELKDFIALEKAKSKNKNG